MSVFIYFPTMIRSRNCRAASRSGRSTGARAGWLVALSVLFGLLSVPALARTDPDGRSDLDDPWNVTFRLETIRIEGLRHVRQELLLAEARLEEGVSYSESELGRAIDRVRRLPFVREASFALRKGSRRGLYELVIAIEETRRLFFGVSLLYSEHSGDSDFELDGIDDDREPGLLAGVRAFAGLYSTFFLAAADENRLVVGYTRNRLWNRPGTLRLGYEESESNAASTPTFGASVEPSFGPWSLDSYEVLTAAVDLPSGDTDSWGLELEHREAERGTRRLGADPDSILFLEDFVDDRLTTNWLRDTTDDALFAERGLRQVITLTYRRVRADLTQPFVAGFDEPPFEVESQSYRLGFLGSRWWTPVDRRTVWGSLNVAVATTEIDELAVTGVGDDAGTVRRLSDLSFGSAEIAAAVGYRYRFPGGRSGEGTRRYGGAFREIYWETSFEIARTEAFSDLVGGVLVQFEARTGVVWRTSWGVFRAGFRFVDAEQSS
ncbi:MAG: hypothetical protein MPN21_07600 [Thermoanaerobaculia bacterium]|nr:hypothetical protein [Thermoanaerobaculia bacterium]